MRTRELRWRSERSPEACLRALSAVTMGSISGSYYVGVAGVVGDIAGRPVFFGRVRGAKVCLQRAASGNRALVPKLRGRIEADPGGGSRLVGRYRSGVLPLLCFAVPLAALVALVVSASAGIGLSGLLLLFLVVQQLGSWSPDRAYVDEQLEEVAGLVREGPAGAGS